MKRQRKRSRADTPPRQEAPALGRLPPRLHALLPTAALFLLTLVVFAPVVRHEFLNWDDYPSIAGNPAYNPPTGASLLRYWTELRPSAQFYVPVMQSTWWILAALTGSEGPDGSRHLSPVPFHMANWLAHATAAALAFVLIRRLVRNRAAAWMGAALFALHPIQVEAVSWASTLYTPLSTALALASLWQLARYFELRYDDQAPDGSEAGALRRRAWWALAIGTLCLLAGLLTKPAVVLAPVVAFALEVGIRRRPWKQVAGPVMGWMLLSVPIMIVAKITQPPAAPYWPVWQRPFLAADALTFYASKILVPVQLATDYGRSPNWLAENGAWHYTWVAPVLAAAGLLLIAVRWRTLWPLACGTAFLAAALPTLGLTPFDYQDYSTVADRYVYFAMFAVGLAAAGALTLPQTPRARTRAYTVAVGVLALFAVLSHLQVYRWRDSMTLFRHTVAVNPNSLAGHLGLGVSADQAGDKATAAEHFRLAMEAHPDNMITLIRLGDFTLRLGRYQEAVTLYERATTFPRPPPAKLFSNLGVALSQCGRQTEAAAALERALALEPQLLDAHLSLAVVRTKLGQWEAARSHFEQALRLDPKSAPAREGLAQLRAMGH